MKISNVEEIVAKYPAPVVTKITKEAVRRLGVEWVPDNMIDWESVGYHTFAEVLMTYDPEGNAAFGTYLARSIENSIKTEITRLNAGKRGNGDVPLSLDAPISEEDEGTLADFVPAREMEDHPLETSDGVKRYMDSLTSRQKEIVRRILDGKSQSEIVAALGISRRELGYELKAIRSEEKRKLLVGSAEKKREKSMTIEVAKGTKESYKHVNYSAKYLADQFTDGNINFNHPQQRHADQWTTTDKGDLIVTMLHKWGIFDIVIAEQIHNGFPVLWGIDGKQRTTTIRDYINGKFAISPASVDPLIPYVKTKIEDGEVVLDSQGFPVRENITIDVTGKRFGDLPKELQETILEYNIGAQMYLDCSEKEITQHILRYNQGRKMNKAQIGVASLGMELSNKVKQLTQSNFFKVGNFRASDFKNGSAQRVVIDSLMAGWYFDSWHKNLQISSKYLEANATMEATDELTKCFGNLAGIVSDKTSKLFTSKDAFLWVATYKKFLDYNLPDEKFAEFMEAFDPEKEINGTTFVVLSGKGTKDKTVVKAKISYLVKQMEDFIGAREIEIPAEAKEFVETFAEHPYMETLAPSCPPAVLAAQSLILCRGGNDFSVDAMENALKGVTQEEVDDIIASLDDVETFSLEAKDGEFFDPAYLPSLIAMASYAVKEEAPKYFVYEEWLRDYMKHAHHTGTVWDDYMEMKGSLNTYSVKAS